VLVDILKQFLIFGASVNLQFSISDHTFMMMKLFTILPLS
jgi:hypothetical protein